MAAVTAEQMLNFGVSGFAPKDSGDVSVNSITEIAKALLQKEK
jgi:hypothetical protein